MASFKFHEGDLSSGITRAIQQQKFVACFIRQDNEESRTWEHDWLERVTVRDGDDESCSLGKLLGQRAVLLRIEFGSTEADFLNAFCPISHAPTMAVIHNGQVLEKLESGITLEEFAPKLLRALGFESDKATVQDASREDETADGLSHGQGADAVEPPITMQTQQDLTSVPQPVENTQATPSESPQPSSNVQSMLNERAQRLETERVKREAQEKAERISRANARRKEAEEASAAHKGKEGQTSTTEQSEKQKSRDAWLYQQKQRKDEAKKERERILNQIESDKQERRAKAKRQKEVEALGGGGAFSEVSSSSNRKPTAGSADGKCSLQVRLFDGSSIRGKFASDADIATAVRTWVQAASPEGGADIPYTFRQILAPQPSRSIEMSEEHQSLLEIGLVPSATLVLVPVSGYTDAYASSGGGYMGTAMHAASSVVSTAYSVASTALSYVPGFGGAGASHGLYMGGTGDGQEASNVEGARMAAADSTPSSAPGSTKVHMKTLADQRAEAAKKDGAQFYNGNSLRFEERDDDAGRK